MRPPFAETGLSTERRHFLHGGEPRPARPLAVLTSPSALPTRRGPSNCGHPPPVPPAPGSRAPARPAPRSLGTSARAHARPGRSARGRSSLVLKRRQRPVCPSSSSPGRTGTETPAAQRTRGAPAPWAQRGGGRGAGREVPDCSGARGGLERRARSACTRPAPRGSRVAQRQETRESPALASAACPPSRLQEPITSRILGLPAGGVGDGALQPPDTPPSSQRGPSGGGASAGSAALGGGGSPTGGGVPSPEEPPGARLASLRVLV